MRPTPSAILCAMLLRSRLATSIFLFALAGCTKPGTEAVPAEPESEPTTQANPPGNPEPEAGEPTTTPAGTTQLANPASVNCEQKGGKLEIETTPAGQQGICVLADGTRCEEWAYMRGECPKP